MDLPKGERTGVYLILNTVNGKRYVGSASVSLRQRAKSHRECLRSGRHTNVHLQRAWDKYGEAAFRFKVICYCTSDECLTREQHWMDRLNVFKEGYNRSPTASSCLGVRRSEETKRKVSAAKKGSRHTLETRLRMSMVRKGRKPTLEHRANLSKSHWSKGPRAAEIAARIALAKSGVPLTDEHRLNVSLGMKKRKTS